MLAPWFSVGARHLFSAGGHKVIRNGMIAGYASPGGSGNRLVARLMARQCAWCHRAMSVADQILIYLGARTTHGMCPACTAEWNSTPAVS